MKFKNLNLKEEILKVIEKNGYTIPTKIQEEIIPIILEGNDVLGQSQTGTGKTLAFAAPILTKIKIGLGIQTLILAPTRELVIQISRDIEDLSQYTNIKTTCVYGSSSITDQINKLKKGSEIVIGTPGRVKDLITRRVLKLDNISFFVLDEADEMLSMGFQEELEFIFEKVNKSKQVLLFSATMPKSILQMAKKYMNNDYKTITVKSETETADNIVQNYYVVNDRTRLESICRVIDYYNPNRAIIFCRTKRNADETLEKLTSKKYSVDIIHGDITQSQRIATLDRFKSGVFNYLIATDVAARGIHVEDVDLVINYNIPESNEAYIHRIGRTGRVNKSGVAITFVKEKEESIIFSIERHIKTKINKCELPKKEEILSNRVNEVINNNNLLLDKSLKSNMFNNYVNNLNEDQIKNLLEQLLERQLLDNLGSSFDVDITVKGKNERKYSRNDKDSVRVFMTIGKIDKIKKRELLSFIEKKASIPQNTCTNVEIMTKFTFMNINNKYYQKVIDTCNNMKYKNRTIKIEKAKN